MEPKTSIIASFNVPYLQFINANSQLTQTLPAFADETTLLSLYQQMALIRHFDNKAINLQRTGKLGTYPSVRGQEALGVGIGHAMAPTDIFCPYYRDQATLFLRGVLLSEILAYWGGDERGSLYKKGCQADFPTCIPIAGQFLHAAGVAYALQYREKPHAVLATGGEGSTSKGDFYEAINLAGCWQLPIVFVINNNQWAISVSREKQTKCQTIAQKAIAGGFQGLQVDGNDVVAVRFAVEEALEKARHGGGPTLIEAITYRLADHTTADDATRYVPAPLLKEAWKQEPVARLAYYLESKDLWSREKETELQKQLNEIVEKEIEIYLDLPKAPPTDMIDYLYDQLPKALQSQHRALMQESK